MGKAAVRQLFFVFCKEEEIRAGRFEGGDIKFESRY